MTSTVTRWWWVRHAPVTANKGRIYGARDVACDVDDTESFRGLAGMLPAGAVLVTSHLKRTTMTAQAIVRAGLALPPAHVEPALGEQNFGDWQGMTYEEFGFRQDGLSRRYWLAPAYERAPNGESFLDLIARVVPAVTRLTEEYVGRDIVAVAHGGTIRAAAGFALGVDPETSLRFSTANLAVTRLDCIDGSPEGRQWRVAFVNRLPHLG